MSARAAFAVEGSGPPVILSHGVIESSESWADVVSLLRDRFTVVVHDARGRGASPVPSQPFNHADLGDDVQALSDRLGFDSFFHAGHSMGGRVALEHALAHAGRVRAIAVISARAEAPDDTGRRRLSALAARARALGPGAAVDIWTTPNDPHYERVRSISACNPVEGTVAALEALVRMDSLLPRLHEVRVPALIVAGDHDAAYVRSAHLMAEAMPAAELRILGGVGHFPNLQCPALLAGLLADFFAAFRLYLP